MNYLAHFYLSGKSEPWLVGNFIADAVKGADFSKYDPEVAAGIRMHRAIDHFTDHHPVVLQSTQRLRAEYRHYAPVIIDIFYDHFLAVHWNQYSSEKLTDFAEQSYDTLNRHYAIMPERSAFILKHMKSGDWLSSYRTVKGIERVMGGMARRARYESKMETSHVLLEQHYDLFSREFLDYFPELMRFIKSNFPGPHHF